jgi:hypothetical protein
LCRSKLKLFQLLLVLWQKLLRQGPIGKQFGLPRRQRYR